MEECCATCSRCLKLEKFDYSHGGCKHTDMEGYACTVFMREGTIAWMIGIDQNTGMCEAYSPKEDVT